MLQSKDFAIEWIDKNRSDIIGISDKIWEYAELSEKKMHACIFSMIKLELV